MEDVYIRLDDSDYIHLYMSDDKAYVGTANHIDLLSDKQLQNILDFCKEALASTEEK